MAYSDLASIHNPSTGAAPPATWGDQVNDNSAFLYLRGPYRCTAATHPGSPTSGDIIYETDTKFTKQYDGSGWWTIGITGNTVTSFTGPVLSQGVSTNISGTLPVCEYRIINGVCEWWFNIAVTASGTAGSALTLTLPVTASAAANRNIGAGYILDSSASTADVVSCELASTTTMVFVAGESAANYWGASPNIAIASGDTLRGKVSFRVASAA